MRKTIGWLLVVAGVLWAAFVVMKAPPSGADGLGTSELLGALTVPALVALLGFYFAGVIKKAR